MMINLFNWLHNVGAMPSRAEYKRLTIQGAIKVNDVVINADLFCECEVMSGDKINIGKTREYFVAEIGEDS